MPSLLLSSERVMFYWSKDHWIGTTSRLDVLSHTTSVGFVGLIFAGKGRAVEASF